MTERTVDTGFWQDPFVQTLDKDCKYLFIYLWTNRHCNQAGLYEITLKTIAFETGLLEMELPALFEKLEQKIKWDREHNLVWVKNFLKRQSKSSTFITAAAKCLNNIKNNGLISEFIEYYYNTYSISIPYPYNMDSKEPPSDLILPNTRSNALSDTGGGDKKEGENKNGLRKQVIAGLSKRRKYKSPDQGKEVAAINWMLENGYTPDEILKAYDKIKGDKFWDEKHLDMQTIKKNIGALKQGATQVNDPDRFIKGEYGHMVKR